MSGCKEFCRVFFPMVLEALDSVDFRFSVAAKQFIGSLLMCSSFTEPACFAGERLSNLAIKIGFEFSKMRLDTRNYVLCAEVAGPVAGGATLSAYCQTPTVGRFVFIQLQENQPLTLCEVKVFTTGGTSVRNTQTSIASSPSRF